MSLVIRGGTIIDSDGEKRADVAIGDEGIITEVSTNLKGDEELDASGCIVTSGFVDLHSHLR